MIISKKKLSELLDKYYNEGFTNGAESMKDCEEAAYHEGYTKAVKEMRSHFSSQAFEANRILSDPDTFKIWIKTASDMYILYPAQYHHEKDAKAIATRARLQERDLEVVISKEAPDESI